MSFTSFLFVPTILFMIFVAPLWIIFHYKSKRKEETGLSEHERLQLEELLVKLDKMSDRIKTLEEILDDRHGSWRSKSDKERYHS
ncbi:envelope stress response membrane protein PspB [Sessilibacter sp. MAH2]